MQVLGIQRVQNAVMWASYRGQRIWLQRDKYQGLCQEDALETLVWHGTGTRAAEDVALTGTGWSSGWARDRCLFGAGSYFAQYPHYPDKNRFRSKTSDGHKQLILCSLLTGARQTVLCCACMHVSRLCSLACAPCRLFWCPTACSWWGAIGCRPVPARECGPYVRMGRARA